MKRTVLVLLVSAAILSCTKKETPKVMEKNYIPETPKLSSDIMTPEVLWSMGRLGDMSVSPDGNTVAYTVTWFKIDENKSYRDIYLTPVQGGKVRRLTNTEARESSVCWRPDGKKIAYLSAASGEMQLWEIDPEGNEAKQVTEVAGGITGFKYSPDQKKLLYTKEVKLDSTVQDLFPDLPLASARIENDLMYRHWDRWHNYTYSHIFVAKYSDGKAGDGKDIMPGERFDSPDKPFDGMEQISWSADGRKIAYASKKLTGKAYAVSTNTDIYIYDADSEETSNFTAGMPGYDKAPVFSPNGKYLAWESMARDGYEADKARLFVADLETGRKQDYSASFDQSSHGLSWSADSRSIYFISDIHATDEIYRLDLLGGTISRLTDGIHDYLSVVETPHGLLAPKTSMSQPAELYLVDAASGNDKAVTSINDGILDQLTRGKVEKRWMTTTDGKEMLTWVIYPPHFDPTKKYPTILYCQGGPQSTVSQFWSYRWNFQMMAANGYIVVAPNRRGLPGFGQEWLEQISTDYGGQNIQDYLTAIDEMAKEPFVDKDRLGAVGASYGGFSVNYLAGHHEKRFKAFISHCGIFNFEQQYLTTEEMWFENWDIGGPYWDKANEVAQRSYSFSPHLFVDKWDTPILIVHGQNDYRIPFTQGMAAFNAAVLRGVPAQFLYFPEESHWVLQPQNGILWQRVFQQWLDKWLKE